MFGKIFERVILNQVFDCLGLNKSLTLNQSGFCWKSLVKLTCINCVWYLHVNFKNNPSLEARTIFGDRKAFDRTCHEDFLCNCDSLCVLVKLIAVAVDSRE